MTRENSASELARPEARLAPLTERLAFAVALGFVAIGLALGGVFFALDRRHRAVEASVESMALGESSASAAAYEMESAIAGAGLAISEYLNAGGDEARARVERHATSFERAQRRYRSAASTASQRELGDQLRALHLRHHKLGADAMALHDRREELRRRIAADVAQLDGASGDVADPVARSIGARAIRLESREVARALGRFLAVPDAVYQARAIERLDALERAVGRARAEAQVAPEVARLGVLLELLNVDVREFIDADARARQASADLVALRSELDTLHHNVQVLAQQETAAAGRQATSQIRPAASLPLVAVLMIVAGIAGVAIFRSSLRLRSAVADLDAETRRRQAAELERTRLLDRLVTAHEDERARISRELHDEMGQKLSALIFGLDRIVSGGASAKPDAGSELGKLRDIASELLDDAHAVAHQLRPPALSDLGLQGALADLVESWQAQSGVEVDFFCELPDRLPPAVETAVFRVVQEALTNVRKHANASSVSVVVQKRTGEVRLVIDDDGLGFDADAAKPGGSQLGLRGMRERVEALGGSLEIESEAAHGTTLAASIPIA